MPELKQKLPVSAPGSLTRTSLTLRNDLTQEEGAKLLTWVANLDHSRTWWLGDLWAYGDRRELDKAWSYGARKALVESEDWTGPTFQTCANAASVCKAFESSRRREALHSVTTPNLPI
jgi:hypothetical protein